ncbi:MAG: type II secretion system protein GspJ [Planctomycetota bacterium]
MKRGKSGFTLVEVMVASVIGAFIALVAVGALRSISASTERIDTIVSVAAEARFAANMVSRDLVNIYRAPNMKSMKLVGGVDRSLVGGRDSWLTLYTVGRAKARIDQPEGDVYEVEYYLERDEEKSVLMRRLWPNPDIEAEPGGMLTVVAEDIDIFEVRFFDGEEWQIEWFEEITSIPELVEVTLAAGELEGRETAVESFVVSFARPWWVGEGVEGRGEAAEEEPEERPTEDRPEERASEREDEREDESEAE